MYDLRVYNENNRVSTICNLYDNDWNDQVNDLDHDNLSLADLKFNT